MSASINARVPWIVSYKLARVTSWVKTDTPCKRISPISAMVRTRAFQCCPMMSSNGGNRSACLVYPWPSCAIICLQKYFKPICGEKVCLLLVPFPQKKAVILNTAPKHKMGDLVIHFGVPVLYNSKFAQKFQRKTYPLVICYSLQLKMAQSKSLISLWKGMIFHSYVSLLHKNEKLVDGGIICWFSLLKIVIFHSFLYVYQRVNKWWGNPRMALLPALRRWRLPPPYLRPLRIQQQPCPDHVWDIITW